MPIPGFVREKGQYALGFRLRRLSERIDREIARAYVAHGLPFEPRWHAIFERLIHNGPMSASALADEILISHPAVSQTCGLMEKAGIIGSRPDETDRRKRAWFITPSGEAIVEPLQQLWSVFNKVFDDIIAEVGDVMPALNGLDASLDSRSFSDRVQEKTGSSA